MLRDELVDELGLLRRDMCAVECVCCGNKIYLLTRRGRCRECKSNIYSIQLRSLTLHNWHRIYYWIECISACPSLILDFTVLWPFCIYILFVFPPTWMLIYCILAYPDDKMYASHDVCEKVATQLYLCLLQYLQSLESKEELLNKFLPSHFQSQRASLPVVVNVERTLITSIHIAPLWSIDDGEVN